MENKYHIIITIKNSFMKIFIVDKNIYKNIDLQINI